MAIIQCPECTKEISDQAVQCPHCGYPLSPKATDRFSSIAVPPKTSFKKKHLFFIVGGILALIVLFFVVKGLLPQKLTALTVDTDGLYHPALGIGVHLGQSKEEIDKVLGVSAEADGAFDYSIGVSVTYADGKAAMLKIIYPNDIWITKGGIGLSSSKSEILAALGEPRLRLYDDRNWLYQENDHIFSLLISDNAVIAFQTYKSDGSVLKTQEEFDAQEQAAATPSPSVTPTATPTPTPSPTPSYVVGELPDINYKDITKSLEEFGFKPSALTEQVDTLEVLDLSKRDFTHSTEGEHVSTDADAVMEYKIYTDDDGQIVYSYFCGTRQGERNESYFSQGMSEYFAAAAAAYGAAVESDAIHDWVVENFDLAYTGELVTTVIDGVTIELQECGLSDDFDFAYMLMRIY